MTRERNTIYAARGTNKQFKVTHVAGVNGNRTVYFHPVDDSLAVRHESYAKFKKRNYHLKGDKI